MAERWICSAVGSLRGNAPGSGAQAGERCRLSGLRSLPALIPRSVLRLPGLRLCGSQAEKPRAIRCFFASLLPFLAAMLYHLRHSICLSSPVSVS